MTPEKVANLPAVSTISTGANSSCALASDGTVWCWGRNNAGDLGRGNGADADPHFTPAPVVAISGATKIADGTALLKTGIVENWGMNDSGQLGIGATDSDVHSAPVPVTGLDSVVDVSSRGGRCALRTDGHVWCWGNNSYGALGVPLPNGETYSANPVEVIGLTNISVIDGSGCAVGGDASLACWGNNDQGQMGLGDDASPVMTVPTPTPIPNVQNISQVVVGYTNNCVLLSAGQVMCAGSNDSGELGMGYTSNAVRTFTLVPQLSNIKKLAVGGQFACALNADSQLLCWGMNLWGELGRGNNATAPVAPATIEPVKWP